MTTRSRTTSCRRVMILAVAPFALTLSTFVLVTPALAKGPSMGAVEAVCKKTKGCFGDFEHKTGMGSGCSPNECFICNHGTCQPARGGGRTPITGTGSGSLLRAMTAAPKASISQGAVSTVTTSKVTATKELAHPAFSHSGGTGRHR